MNTYKSEHSYEDTVSQDFKWWTVLVAATVLPQRGTPSSACVFSPGEALQASQFSPKGMRNFSTFCAPLRDISSSHVYLPLQESSIGYTSRLQCFADHIDSQITVFFPHHSAISNAFSMMAFYTGWTWHISTTNVRLEQFPPYTQAIRRRNTVPHQEMEYRPEAIRTISHLTI